MKEGKVGLPIAIVVSRHWHVPLCPPLRNDGTARIAARNDEPLPGRRPKDGKIGLAVAVVVPWYRNVPEGPPLRTDDTARIAARDDEPLPGRRPKDGEIGFAIAIVVSLHRDITLRAPPQLDGNARIAGGDDGPPSIRGLKHRYVRLLVSIKVATCARRGRLKCSDQVQPAMADIGADGHRMSQSGGGPCLVDVGLPIPQQSSGPRNEGRAEGGSPSSGVGAKRIGGNDG